MTVIMTEKDIFAVEGKPDVFGDTVVVSGKIIGQMIAGTDLQDQFDKITRKLEGIKE